MKRTGRIVVTTLLIMLVAVVVRAQTQPPAPQPTTPQVAAPRPLDRNNLREHIYTMEGALMRAVSLGAQQLTREIRSVVPEMIAFSGEPHANGVYLEGYGVYFNVGVPVLHQSAIWSFTTMIRQDGKGLADSLTVLKQKAKEARTPAEREAIENAIGIIELQQGFNSAARPAQLPLMSSTNPGPSMAARPDPTLSQQDVASQTTTMDRKYLDPNAINRAYTESVQRALINAMIEYSLPMAIAADEFLTVGARDNMHRDSFAPYDPFEEVITVILRIKGSDLAAYRAGQIDREEARKRVQVREF